MLENWAIELEQSKSQGGLSELGLHDCYSGLHLAQRLGTPGLECALAYVGG